MASEDPIHEEERNADSAESIAQARQVSPEAPRELNPPALPRPKTNRWITCEIKKNWWDRTKDVVQTVGVVLLFIYTAYTIKMYHANKEAADAATKAANTAAKELEFSERPWVSLDNFTIESPLKFDKNGSALITFGFEIKNSGRSPAVRGFWQQDFFLQFGDTPSPVRKRDDLCKLAATRSTRVTDPRIAETWFSGDPMPKKIQMGFGPDEIANALKIPQRMFPNVPDQKDFDAIYPDFAVCVAYRSAFTETQYHTGYILQLGKTTAESPYIFPMKNGEIPASDLQLYIHPFYGIDTEDQKDERKAN